MRGRIMDIFRKMQQLTRGETEPEPKPVQPQVGDTIQGIITNVVHTDGSKKGGYGFIASQTLPYERIFFHWSGLRQDTLRFPELRKKQKVEFILQYSERSDTHEGGYRAIKIRVLE